MSKKSFEQIFWIVWVIAAIIGLGLLGLGVWAVVEIVSWIITK